MISLPPLVLHLLLLLSWHGAHAAATSADSPSDLEAIRKTINYYPLAIDSKDFSLLSRVFTHDVVANYGPGVGTLVGLSAVETGLQAALHAVLSQHALSTQVIDLHAGDAAGSPSANTTTYFTANQFGQGAYTNEVVYSYGRYVDNLVKVKVDHGNDWRICNRTLVYMGPNLGNLLIFT